MYNNVKEARLEPEFTQKTSLCLQRSFFEGVPELADLLASTTSYTVGLEVEQDTQTLEWIYKGRYDLMLKKIAVEEVKDEVIEVSDDE